MNNNRTIQFDVLKIIAAFAVVWLHTSAQNFDECYPSFEWDIRNFYDSLVRWSVPIFIMVSGALFLNQNKQIKIRTLYSKNIIRLVLVFLFWSFVYCAYGGIGENGCIGFIENILYGPFHFWFLKVLIGLYICVPILRPVVTNTKSELYFICLSLVTAFIIPMLFPFIGFFSDAARNYAEKSYDAFNIKIALGYVGYFVLGHYLSHLVVSKNVKKCLCLLGVMSVVAVCGFTKFASNNIGVPWVGLYAYNNLFVLFEASAVFVVLKDIRISQKYYDVLIRLSKLSLGVYVIHPLVMSIMLDLWGINSASLNPLFFIPVFAVMIFVVSYSFSYVMSKVPLIKKFIY